MIGRIMEELINDERRRIAHGLLEMEKLSIEEIAKCSQLPLEVVEELANNMIRKD